LIYVLAIIAPSTFGENRARGLCCKKITAGTVRVAEGFALWIDYS
jgi:hypothetical protein